MADSLQNLLQKFPIAEVEAAWEAEIDRRLAEYDCGEVQAIDAEEVFAKAQKIAADLDAATVCGSDFRFRGLGQRKYVRRERQWRVG